MGHFTRLLIERGYSVKGIDMSKKMVRHAPQEIQKMIINSSSVPLTENFKYYWKRLRTSGYLDTWIFERKKFIERREYYKKAQEWKKEIVKCAMTMVDDYYSQNGKTKEFSTAAHVSLG